MKPNRQQKYSQADVLNLYVQCITFISIMPLEKQIFEWLPFDLSSVNNSDIEQPFLLDELPLEENIPIPRILLPLNHVNSVKAILQSKRKN